MSYLVVPDSTPPMIDVRTRPIEWIELVGTWGILVFVIIGVFQKVNHGGGK